MANTLIPEIKILHLTSFSLSFSHYFYLTLHCIYLFMQRGPNKVPLYAMAVVAVVTVTFIIVGDINFLAPIVTMPFLMTYACIDYAYFALAQTFDIQEQREERFRIQASSPSYETRRYGSVSDGGNDLDLLFPDRVRHKNLQSPQNSPMHQTQPTPQAPTENIVDFDAPAPSTSTGQGDATTTSDRTSLTVEQSTGQVGTELEDENEPIAPIRPPIHSKTKTGTLASAIVGPHWRA